MNVHAFSHLPGKVASRRVHLLLVRMALIFALPRHVELVLAADIEGDEQPVGEPPCHGGIGSGDSGW